MSVLNTLISPEFLEEVQALLFDFGLVPANFVTPSLYDELCRRYAQELMQQRMSDNLSSDLKELRDEHVSKVVSHFRRSRHHWESDSLSGREYLIDFDFL